MEVVSLQGHVPSREEMLPHARLEQNQGKGQSWSGSCLRHLTSGKAIPWVIKHLCMGLETVTVSPHYNYG